MRSKMIPQFVLEVLEVLESRGYEAFAVGGCCRDVLLGREPQDWDVCTSAKPNEIIDCFPNCIPTGIKHGTVTVRAQDGLVEVTTYRIDGEYHDHRRPENVVFTKVLREDLARRDFTMNAIAMSKSGEIFDPFDGASDIKAKIIRSVGDPILRFSEDALRMFRAMRFCAQLGFRFADDIIPAMKKLSNTAEFIATERVFNETRKTIMSENPHHLQIGIECGLYSKYLEKTEKVDLSPISALEMHQTSRFCALAALLLSNGLIKSAESFLLSIKAPSDVRRAASLIFTPTPVWEREKTLAEIVAAVGRENAGAAAAAMYAVGLRDAIENMNVILNEERAFSILELDISGDDLIALGFSGKEIGLCQQKLLRHVLAAPEDNQKEILLNLARDI